MNYLLDVGQGSRLTCTSCMMYLLLRWCVVCVFLFAFSPAYGTYSST